VTATEMPVAPTPPGSWAPGQLVVIGSGPVAPGTLEMVPGVVVLGSHQTDVVLGMPAPAAILVAPAGHEPSAAVIVASLRTRTCAPLVAVLAGSTERERIAVLEAGADDCVEATVGVGELLARLAAVARRPGLGCARVAGGVELDLVTRDAFVGGRPVELTRREFDLLALLVGSPRRVFTHQELLHDVWGMDHEVEDTSTVTEHVRRLRSKLRKTGGSEGCIGTVRGVGYRFDPARCTAHEVVATVG
jgi:DNA-binding response OmpR family regulator